MSGRRNGRIDLGLALLAVFRKPDEELTFEDIAAWCDCPASTIFRIYLRALENSRWHPQNPALRRAILAAMKTPTNGAKPFPYKPQHGLIIVCADEADQKRKYETLKRRGLKVRVVTV